MIHVDTRTCIKQAYLEFHVTAVLTAMRVEAYAWSWLISISYMLICQNFKRINALNIFLYFRLFIKKHHIAHRNSTRYLDQRRQRTLKKKIIVSIVLVRPHSPIVVPILSPWVTARQINLISLLPLQIYMSLPLRSLLKIDFNYLVRAFLH